MKLTIEADVLKKALDHVQRVVERRATIPILNNVLLRAEGAEIALKATDLDLEIVETVKADVEIAGATTVSAYILHDITKKLPSGAEAAIELSDQTLTLKSGRSRFQLHVLPDSDFPDLTVGEWPISFTIEAGKLRKLIKTVQFAISSEETRYYLNGIYLHCKDKGNRKLLCAVATDGHRLAYSHIDSPAPDVLKALSGIIIPRKTVDEFERLLAPADAEAKVEISDTKIRLSIGNVVVTSKLIDGTFPDYTRVIPQGNDKVLKLDRAEFARAVDRVSTITSERGHSVKLSLEDGKLVLACSNPDTGNAVEEMGVEYAADALDIGFNSRYLLDVAGQLGTGSAEFKFADPGSPTVVRDVDDDDTLFVLMPMRV